MRVFRMENEEGKGICISETGLCDAYHEATDQKHSCCKCTKFGEKKNEAVLCLFVLDWKFAFPSVSDAKAWFPDEKGRAAMAAKGCHLTEYEVDNDLVLFDTELKQVLFDIAQSTKIATRDLVTME